MQPNPNTRLAAIVLATAVGFLSLTGVAAAAAPSASTNAASSVAASSARLNGNVNPNGQSTNWYFEFGTSTSYGTKTAAKNAGAGTHSTSVSMSISGLAASTTYHFRIVASNGSGTVLGNDQSFTTVGPPAVQTGPAQSVTTTAATLTGTLDPRGSATTWFFDYGTSTAYTARTPVQNGGTSPGARPISIVLSNITPNTTYHFRLVATNDAGRTLGSDATFTTLPSVTIKQSDLRVVAGHVVTLSGTVAGGPVGAQVTILAEPFGASSYTQLAQVVTGGGGSWSYLARPTIGTSYEASAGGGTSTSVQVGVQPAVSLERITRARFLTHVSAAGSFAGKLVQFQRLVDGRWVTVRQMRLSAASSAVFPGTLLPRGTWTLRIAMSVNQAGPGYLGGFSRTLSFHRT